MNARELTRRLGGRWHGGYGTARCPAHKDRNPSLSIRDGERAPLLVCHAGCSSLDVLAAIGRENLPAPAERGRPPEPVQTDYSEHARELWSKAGMAQGTKAAQYLRARGITLLAPPSLRYLPAGRYSPSGISLPCMIAAVQAPDRRIIAVHRTFLDPSGDRKAQVTQPRMWLGSFSAGAIRFAPPAERLAIAEGIETALSYQQLTGCSTWAAGSAKRLAAVEFPPEVKTVVIAADNGAPGQEAARTAAETIRQRGLRVEIHYPPDGCGDWNDVVPAAAAKGVA